MYHEFEPRGVIFLGLTAADRPATQQYLDEQVIAWPNGFGAQATLQRLGSAAPMVYVVGRDGRIVWSDDRSQYHHDPRPLQRELTDAIQSALREKEQRE